MMIANSTILTVLVGIAVLALVVYAAAWIKMAIVHRPISLLAMRFIDNPIRRLVQPPKDVVNWINIKRGMHVLEIGPGPGTFTIEAAKSVGEQGEFAVVDIQPAIISRLNDRLRTADISNVITKTADASKLPFSDNTFDRVFLIAVLGEIANKERALLEIRRVLRDDGLLAIGEFLQDPDYTSFERLVKLTSAAGFKLTASYKKIIHYLLLFRKDKNVIHGYAPIFIDNLAPAARSDENRKLELSLRK
jgi:ubiquinone/menaquinone biosynthesis C-methylase UbiE